MRRFQILREFACELLGHRWRTDVCGVELGIPTFCGRCGCPAWSSLRRLQARRALWQIEVMGAGQSAGAEQLRREL